MIRINKDLVDYVKMLSRSEGDDAVIEQKYEPKQIILEQRKRVFAVYILISGMAKCYMTEDTGVDFVQEFFGEGEIFGEIEMFNDESSFCSIESITAVSVFKIPHDQFHQLIDSDRRFRQLILKSLATKVKYTAVRHSYNQSHTIETNLLRLKKQFPTLIETIAKIDIANYLGITERSLNRTLNQLRDKKTEG